MNNNFYPQAYHDSTVRNLMMETISKDNAELIKRGKVFTIPDNASSEIAYNNLNGEIGIQSMSSTTKMLEKASNISIQDMEMFYAQQNSIMKTIIDHEIAHGFEPMNKIRGVQIYNNDVLPKLMDGSFGIYDEASFEANRGTLIDFMNDKFKSTYNPSSLEYESFQNFTSDYFLPNGPIGLSNRIAMIDNYISDISIENFMSGIHKNPRQMDQQFKGLRDLLYSNDGKENYSILRSMQIFIDPRYKDSKELEEVMKDEDFQSFLQINIDSLDISTQFYKATTPDEFEQMRMIAIMNELKESVRKIREYAYIIGAYYKYKDEKTLAKKEAMEAKGLITLEDINKRSTVLGKVVYIKELEGDMKNKGIIEEIIKGDDTLGKNTHGFNYSMSGKSNKKTNPFTKKEKENKSSEDSSTKEELILPKVTYLETIQNIGHNNDFGSDLTNMYIEIKDLIKNNLELKNLQETFQLNKSETNFVNKVLKKEVKEDYFYIDDSLISKRENLIHEIKDSDYYYELKRKVNQIENSIDNDSSKLFYKKEDNENNKVINIFIQDSLSSTNQIIKGDYNALDYQIANAMIIKELFENSGNISVNILNIPNPESSLSYVFDSSMNKDIESEDNKILSIEGIKNDDFTSEQMLESLVKLKSIESNTEMLNIVLYNNSENDINFLDSKVFESDKLSKVVNDSIFIDADNLKSNDLSKILVNTLDESLKKQEIEQSTI